MSVRAKRTPIVLFLASAMALVAVACKGGSSPSAGGPDPGSTGEATRLVLELDWVPNPDHVGLYYAQDKGFFSEANLTVDVHAPSNAADPIKLVALNKVDLGISYEPEMFYAQQNQLPVTAVAAVVPVPLNSLIVSPELGVTQLSDMSGRSVGVSGIPSDDAFYTTMLKTAGLSVGEVTKVNVGFSLLPSLLSHKVDGIIGGYRNVEAIQMQQETGRKPTVFPADQLGVPTYAELVVVANSDRLANDGAYADEVTRFISALVKGTDGAIADPSGATRIMRGVTQDDPAFLDESVPYTLTLMTPAAGSKTGCLDASTWQSYGAWMLTNGLITSADASTLQTDRYLPYSCS